MSKFLACQPQKIQIKISGNEPIHRIKIIVSGFRFWTSKHKRTWIITNKQINEDKKPREKRGTIASIFSTCKNNEKTIS